MNARAPAVAGVFYAADHHQLLHDVDHYLSTATARAVDAKALIVPHAGLIYSGPIAAQAYHAIAPISSRIRRVVLLGPSHRVPLNGIAYSGHDAFDTPLGSIPVDLAAIETIRDLPGVTLYPQAHMMEHSLEVQLPFLQRVLDDFSLVPLVVGPTHPERVSAVLEHLWGGEETLLVISTDLSHYHGYNEAQRIDRQTSDAIAHLNTDIKSHQACGCNPLNGMLLSARRHGLTLEELDVRNSGDTSGGHDQVVGYGAYVLH